jgi:hypothetical protein
MCVPSFQGLSEIGTTYEDRRNIIAYHSLRLGTNGTWDVLEEVLGTELGKFAVLTARLSALPNVGTWH